MRNVFMPFFFGLRNILIRGSLKYEMFFKDEIFINLVDPNKLIGNLAFWVNDLMNQIFKIRKVL